MQRRFWDDVDLTEWEAARIFAFLSDDNRRDTLERDYLPVNVQHLRFQERRAITGDDRECRSCHVERSLPLLWIRCSSFNSKRFLHFGRNDRKTARKDTRHYISNVRGSEFIKRGFRRA